MNRPPLEEIYLEIGATKARISSLGAAISYLEVESVLVIEQVTRAAIETAYASTVCAPWPNRIADGLWQGRVLPKNDAHGNALHGLVFDKDFTLVKSDGTSASFVFELKSSELYPFDLLIGVDYEIDQTGISCHYWATNLGPGTAPYGVAAHPYIRVSDESHFSIHAGRRAVNNEKQIPLYFEQVRDDEVKVFGHTNLDDCFTDLIGSVVIRHSDGSMVEVWQDGNFPYLMVFTAHDLRAFGISKPGLAIEPQTCPANAFNTGEDLIWLSTGASWHGNWGIRASRGS